MIILRKIVGELPREKKFSLFGLFGSKKISYKDQIKNNFKWALDYLDYIDGFIEKENNKLDSLGLDEISQFFRFTEISNNTTDITDFIADFNNNKYWVGPDIKPKYIKYDPETNKLFLRQGYPIAFGINHSKDPIIREIRSKADIVKTCKEYFQELQKSLLSTNIKTFERYCTGEDEEVLEMCGGQEGIRKYYQELQKSIKTILGKIV